MKIYRNTILVIALFASYSFFAQDTPTSGIFSGSFESTNQMYHHDNSIKVTLPQDKIASNNYLSLNYSYGKFRAGMQYEAYMPPLVGYSPKLEGNTIAHKYFTYTADFIELTVGNFYEQFGSGLLFRASEDRQLGSNNALNGVNLHIKPTEYFSLKVIYGKQRSYLSEGNGVVRGADANLNIKQFFKINKAFSLRAGASVLNHYELYTGPDPDFPATVNSFSGRIDFSSAKLGFNTEYVYKGADPHDLNLLWYKTGNALTANFSYSVTGLAMNLSLRRLENMDSRSQRNATDNDLMLNYLPANTKQHKYSLANMYPYSTQVMGEMGGQYNLYYRIKKGSLLGGKYGTKLAFNFSGYKNLKTTELPYPNGFESAFFAIGNDLYYSDLNLEMNKKWNKKLKTSFGYMNQAYNKGQIDGGSYPIVHSNIVLADFLYKYQRKKSVRIEMQHLATKQDHKNWASLLIEMSFAPKWSLYAADMYNYGNQTNKIHYYNIGASFVKNTHRIALAYARQRESLMCVGGVCRRVPAFKGFTLSITSSF